MNKIINTLKDNYLIIIFSLLTTIIFFNQQIFGNSFFWEDFLEYVYPVQSFAARESGIFDIPFWNPFSGDFTLKFFL